MRGTQTPHMNVRRYFCALVGCCMGAVTAQGSVLSIKVRGDNLHLLADCRGALCLPRCFKLVVPIIELGSELVDSVLNNWRHNGVGDLLVWDRGHIDTGLEFGRCEGGDR